MAELIQYNIPFIEYQVLMQKMIINILMQILVEVKLRDIDNKNYLSKKLRSYQKYFCDNNVYKKI